MLDVTGFTLEFCFPLCENYAEYELQMSLIMIVCSESTVVLGHLTVSAYQDRYGRVVMPLTQFSRMSAPAESQMRKTR